MMFFPERWGLLAAAIKRHGPQDERYHHTSRRRPSAPDSTGRQLPAAARARLLLAASSDVEILMNANSSVLFVCLGNICRSPLAEAAFRQAVRTAGLELEIDSCGTGDWHIGQAPDPRAQALATRYGVDISNYRARQVERADFARFTHIVAMDRNNLADLESLRPLDTMAQISLLLDHVAGRRGEDVADPYYGNADGFEVTWSDVNAGAAALLKSLTGQAPSQWRSD